MDVQVVWFKRDCRVSDHRPLACAAAAGSVLALYVDEPELWEQPDAGARHRYFLADALDSLRDELATYGLQLCVAFGTIETVLQACLDTFGRLTLWSHEETGNGWSFARDLRVRAWCGAQGVQWHEIPQNGVVRKLRTRNGWAKNWEVRMREPLAYLSRAVQCDARALRHDLLREGLADSAIVRFRERAIDWTDSSAYFVTGQSAQRRTQQVGTQAAARKLLDSFLMVRGRTYRYGLSSPLTAPSACSRLSPHLSFGTISLREVVQRTEARLINVADDSDVADAWKKSLSSFLSRLHWHCHFMQKLESEPRIEFENLHESYTGLREDSFNEAYFSAWKAGMTGIPFLDACMRNLYFTGWTTFRMRAMLCSFSSYQLWLHWQRPAWHLAQIFTDYEPGIHYSQMQMQSGTSGVNTIRMYNPVKQGIDYDPEGGFIRRWCPELASLPTAFLHEPWRVDPSLLAVYGVVLGQTYPAPVVDHLEAARSAREAVWSVRQGKHFQEIARGIQEKHGSRSGGLSMIRKRKSKKHRSMDTLAELPLFEQRDGKGP